jgi:hypothetical protein
VQAATLLSRFPRSKPFSALEPAGVAEHNEKAKSSNIEKQNLTDFITNPSQKSSET